MDIIKNYTIVKAHNLNELISIVNDYLNDVWQPIGGVQAIKEMDGRDEIIVFYQALVEYYPQKK
jgi:hypothetical protein